MRQLHCNAKCAFKTQVLVTFLCFLAFVKQDLGFTREKFGIDLILVSVSGVPPVCQTTTFCFIEKVVPLSFGFYSSGN